MTKNELTKKVIDIVLDFKASPCEGEYDVEAYINFDDDHNQEVISKLVDLVSEKTQTRFNDEKMEDIVQGIYDAWTIVGPIPAYHQDQQTILLRKWPSLYHAVIKLVRFRKGQG